MICSSANWRTISQIAFCSSVLSVYGVTRDIVRTIIRAHVGARPMAAPAGDGVLRRRPDRPGGRRRARVPARRGARPRPAAGDRAPLRAGHARRDRRSRRDRVGDGRPLRRLELLDAPGQARARRARRRPRRRSPPPPDEPRPRRADLRRVAGDRVARHRRRALKIGVRVPITPGMDLHDKLAEHLGLDTALTPEQAAQILVGAAGYARDALRALDECTRPDLDQPALRDLSRRATVIESHLRALHALALERCADAAVCDIPVAVEANLELAAKCRTLICQRTVAVDQEVMILRAPLAAFQLPC